MKKKLVFLLFSLFACSIAFAQDVKAVLVDANTGDPIGFATVSISREGQEKPLKYVLSSDSGKVDIDGIRKGNYTFKVELLGYTTIEKKFTSEGKDIDLGTFKLELDNEQLEAAKVSAAGNPVIIKKDTIEYNASSFLTAENAVLEDLLKKLPGIEVSENGTISSNGQTISKITIDGKTFFLDDPSIASKNIPAKLINKLKVIQKKSEQAEFTGIDDGREETVIDLSVQPGMMQGLIGRVQAGAGADIPSSVNTNKDFRYNGNAFIGRFRENTQISLILNANNANRGAGGNFAGGMMGAMMGGGGMMGGGVGGFGGSNGITTTYMAGLNIAGDLLDDRMELGGDYTFNWGNTDVMESSVRTTFRPDNPNLITSSDGSSNSLTRGHSIGFRLDHQFSENSSLLLQPQIQFGNGSSFQNSLSNTYENQMLDANKLNDSQSLSSGKNQNVSASTMFLFRQRLGLPGRTLSVNGNFNFTTNKMDGNNYSLTNTYVAGNPVASIINQNYNSVSNSSSVSANVTYTEPMGNHFYIDAEYSFNWNKSEQGKETFDAETGVQDYAYSNNIINKSTTQQIGANILYQSETFRAQLGFFGIPTHTYNSTTRYDKATQKYEPMEYEDNRWNFSPQAMIAGEFSENSNIRFFYRGNSSQPSTSQLMPVPDNTNPVNVSFGNPSLTPYFSHNINGNYRVSNRRTYFSFNTNFNLGMVSNPITNAVWYGAGGQQYSMPFNGSNTGNASLNTTLSTPIGFSKFSISNTLGGNWSLSSSYVGQGIDMSKYPDPLTQYYEFMTAFISDHPDVTNDKNFAHSVSNTLGINENFRLTWKTDNLTLEGSARTNIRQTWYDVGDNKSTTTTFGNQVAFNADFVSNDQTFSGNLQFHYNWYNGYTTEQPSECVLDITISKTIFKGLMTVSLSGYDILGQTRNLTVTESANYHSETLNNTLGRYVILSLQYNFGSFGRRGSRARMGGGGGMMMGGGMGRGMGRM